MKNERRRPIQSVSCRSQARRFGLMAWMLCLGMAFTPIPSYASLQIPQGAILYLRLLTPVSSYSAKQGDRIRAVLIEPVELDESPVIPEDSIVEGWVRKASKVGMGFHHETALLDLVFDSLVLPTGQRLQTELELLAVENAREVVKDGFIRGVLATDTPQGRINSRLIHLPALNPYTDLALVIFKAAFPIFPEPEIYLPAGSDFQVKLLQSLVIPGDLPPSPLLSDFSSADRLWLDNMVQRLPMRVTDKDGKTPADVTNLLFVGQEEEIRRAFAASGWIEAEPISSRAVARNFNAFLGKQGYSKAPMAGFLLNDRPADLNLQLSLNSYAKRHHVRIWRLEHTLREQPLWLASATHDVGATLSLKRLHFYHRVHPQIDLEREKIVRDLAYVGSLQQLHYAARPGMENSLTNATGEQLSTDGNIAVMLIGSCTRCEPYPSHLEGQAVRYRPGNRVVRYFRKQILIFRSDVLRSNLFYGAYDLSMMIGRKLRGKPSH